MLKKIKQFFSKKVEIPQEEESKTAYIWAVIDGPFEDDEINAWVLMVKANVDDSMIITELYFKTFNQAYDFKRDVDFTPGPVEFEIPIDAEVAGSERKCLKQQ